MLGSTRREKDNQWRLGDGGLGCRVTGSLGSQLLRNRVNTGTRIRELFSTFSFRVGTSELGAGRLVDGTAWEAARRGWDGRGGGGRGMLQTSEAAVSLDTQHHTSSYEIKENGRKRKRHETRDDTWYERRVTWVSPQAPPFIVCLTLEPRARKFGGKMGRQTQEELGKWRLGLS